MSAREQVKRRGSTDFGSLRLSPSLIQVVAELGYEKMTPIQAQSIPLLLEGKDLVGQSKTGSGKTVAFSLPILNSLRVDKRDIQALILCPTRELCTQVAREIRKLGRRLPGLQVLILSGGQPMHPQLEALRKGVHLVVGTPGRVRDHLQRGSLELGAVRSVVLDEADRMLDMGFQEDMEAILKKVPEKRQMLFFSATYPRSIDSMSRAYQHAPVRVTIEDEDGKLSIRQVSYESTPEEKPEALLWLLNQHKPESAIVFCNLKATVTELAYALAREGVSCAALHGDLEQSERDRVMAKFRNHSTRVLIATDVAARGIDLENLDVVFNYDLPAKPDIYVHRIGRTGRAGKSGVAVSLAGVREKSKLQAIEKFTGTPIATQTLGRSGERAKKEGDAVAGAKMATLYISGGRKDKMRPGDILGALTGEAGGLEASKVGKIEIHDRFSYVAVSKEIAHLALQRLRDGRIKGRKFRVEPVR
ncbi:MAG: ATP-dependent RNA helicase DbpA [Bdellovibrionales bacterium GWB1_55_8]|nr:MAG: ATP-dependent RNA helicase DbpA [Bdellovibrionales bacterium GWB1_55_8]